MDLCDTFFFIAHPNGDRSAVQVVDLASVVSHERSDWCVVNDQDFYDRDEAIEYARNLAWRRRLRYVPFSSRYDSDRDE